MKPRRRRDDPFVIPLDRIPEDGLEIRADAAKDPEFAALLAELGEAEGLQATGQARLFVRPWPKRIDVEGEFSAVVPQICSRGLDPYLQPIEATVRQILFRGAGSLGVDAEELELEIEDLDRSELVGDSLLILEILREELHLALPLRPLCVDPCEGPCPAWGRDIPLVEPPKTEEPDPRWAGLAQLKLKK